MILRDVLQLWSPAGPAVTGVRQSGVVPYDVVEGRVVFLLITSRRSGRWIFPKGAVSAGMTPWDSAAKEALEEAGVTGQVGSEAIGAFRNSDRGVLVDVDLYPLRVLNQLDSWQEQHQRLRHWALLAETKRLVNDRTVGRLAEALEAQVLALNS